MRLLHGELVCRMNDPRKIWKLSEMDLKSYRRWYDYSRARDAMLAAIPYRPLTPRDVTLPRRQPAHGYVQPDLPWHYIPAPF